MTFVEFLSDIYQDNESPSENEREAGFLHWYSELDMEDITKYTDAWRNQEYRISLADSEFRVKLNIQDEEDRANVINVLAKNGYFVKSVDGEFNNHWAENYRYILLQTNK